MGSKAEAMTPQQRVVVWVAILSSFVAFLDGSIVNVALPAIRSELGGGVATQQWIVNAYLLALSSLILLAGTLSDSFGRVRVLRVGLAIFGVASLACALAPTGMLLIAARGVQGAGAALLVPSSLAIITSTFSAQARGRAIGTWTAWTGAGFIAGPLLGGLLVDTVGWRWVFAVNAAPIVATLILLTTLRSHEGRSGQRVDITGAALAGLGLAGPVFALIEQQRLGWSHPLVLVFFIGGVISFAAFLWWEYKTVHPMLPLRLFRSRNFAVGNLATVFIYAGVPLGLLTVTLFLQEVAGFSAFEAGLATVPVALLSLLLAQLFGGLAGRFGHRLFVTAGPAIAASGYLVMLTSREPLNFWVQLLPGLLLIGLGHSMTVAPLTASILGSVDTRESGIGSAINNATSRVAGLISISFISVIVGDELDYDGFHRVVIVVAILFLIASVVSLVGIRTTHIPVGTVSAEATALCQDRTVPVAIIAPRGVHDPDRGATSERR